MDKNLRAHIVDRLRHRVRELAPSAIRVAPPPTSEIEVYDFLPSGTMHVFAGVKIASRVDRFFGVIAWSSGGYPVFETIGLPFARFDDIRDGRAALDAMPAEGAMRLDLFARGMMQDYDVNISALGKDDDEYSQWMKRTTAKPTWQELMEPRADRFVRDIAADIARVVVPFAEIVAAQKRD